MSPTSPTPDSTLIRAQASVGLTLRGKWRLERLLGVGGMAAVFEGIHRNGSRAAIKMLHLELSLDAEVKRRFLREGYVANAVDHPGVVRVLDDDVAEDGSAYLVMDLLEGETLDARWLRAGRSLSAGEVLSAMDPVLTVLAAAHARGIVHRDIKPENLFVCRDGSIKLLDFGIARLRESSATATLMGATMGTPAFMPPEQALGHMDAVGPRSDLWAVGASMFALLTGRHVHEGATANEVLVAAATRTAPPLATLLPDVHPAVARLVDVALAFDADARWPDADAMRETLRDAYQALAGAPVESAPRLVVPMRAARHAPAERVAHPSAETTGATGVMSAGPPPVARSPWWLAAGTVALVAAGIGGTLLMPRRQAPTIVSPIATSAAAQGPDSGAPIVAPTEPRPRATGRLQVVVRGGSCALTVDDVPLGEPADALDVEVGPHTVTCRPARGGAIKQSVEVLAGEVSSVTVRLPGASAAPAKTVDPRDRRR